MVNHPTRLSDKSYLREVIEKQKKELTRSIRYAQNIQNAIFPSKDDFQRLFPESFILFLPRDIVSGDFYWMRKISHHILVAVGDCTGHGVPGAFMSLLGITFLNEITTYDPLLAPNRILNMLRERVMKTLNQTGKASDQKDGMDLTLIAYDQKEQLLQCAGANTTLFHFHKGMMDEIKGDRMPISVYGDFEAPFTNHKLTLEEGDRIYLFTDGYVDQFGGPDFKKFKFNRFRKLMNDIQNEPFDKQETILHETLKTWRGKFEQIDDILVMGIGF